MTKKKSEENTLKNIFNEACHSTGYVFGLIGKVKENDGLKDAKKKTKDFTSKALKWTDEFAQELASVTGELTKSFKDGLRSALDENGPTEEKTSSSKAKTKKKPAPKKTVKKQEPQEEIEDDDDEKSDDEEE